MASCSLEVAHRGKGHAGGSGTQGEVARRGKGHAGGRGTQGEEAPTHAVLLLLSLYMYMCKWQAGRLLCAVLVFLAALLLT